MKSERSKKAMNDAAFIDKNKGKHLKETEEGQAICKKLLPKKRETTSAEISTAGSATHYEQLQTHNKN